MKQFVPLTARGPKSEGPENLRPGLCLEPLGNFNVPLIHGRFKELIL